MSNSALLALLDKRRFNHPVFTDDELKSLKRYFRFETYEDLFVYLKRSCIDD